MPADTIQASVGMYDNGTKNCYNLPNDVKTILKLLNLIADADGGTKPTPLPSSASPGQLYRAIRHFQQVQNDLGRTPRLSVDGHVDPGASTLARLNQIAHKITPPPHHLPGGGGTTIAVVPFHEPAPLLIAKDPDSRTKSDLKSTPSATGTLPLPVQVALAVAQKLPTANLQGQMLTELFIGGGAIGTGLAKDFFTNSGSLIIKTHGAGTPLSNLVKASPEFKAAHDEVQQFIRDVVQATAFAGIIDYRELAEPKKKVPPPSLSFGGFQQLHVLIGSFQGVNVFLNTFTADPAKRTYSADLTYEFFDHFGIDDSDTIPDTHGHGSPGQMAFWVLQRERHPGNMPYITRVVFNQPISDDHF